MASGGFSTFLRPIIHCKSDNFTLFKLMSQDCGKRLDNGSISKAQGGLPALDNFYMAGQWVEPGGGVLSTIYSGRNVVQFLCRRDRRPFSPQDTT